MNRLKLKGKLKMTNDELAVFVRREIHLAANGVTEDERIEMNPIPKSGDSDDRPVGLVRLEAPEPPKAA